MPVLLTVSASLTLLVAVVTIVRVVTGMAQGYRVVARFRDLTHADSALQCDAESEISVASAAAARLLAGKVQGAIGVGSLLAILAVAVSDVPRPIGWLTVAAVLAVAFRYYYRIPAQLFASITGYDTAAFTSGSFSYNAVIARFGPAFLYLLLAGILGALGVLLCSLSGANLLGITDGVVGPLELILPGSLTFSPAVNALTSVLLGTAFIAASDFMDRGVRRWAMSSVGEKVSTRGDVANVNVLFLREFGRESQSVLTTTNTDRLLLLRMIPRWRTLLEDCLTWLCWSDGPVISVGDPRHPREKTLGARVFVTEDWKVAVMRLAESCQLIILVCGSNEGIRWETRVVVTNARLARKTVFINSAPSAPSQFLGELALAGLPVNFASGEGESVLLGAILKNRRVVLITSRAAADVDYESVVQRAMLELADGPDALRGILRWLTRKRPERQ